MIGFWSNESTINFPPKQEIMQVALAQCSPRLMGETLQKKSSVSEWHKRGKKVGCENVEDDEKSGRPRSHRIDENGEKVRNLVHSHRRLNIRAMAVELNSDKETVKKVRT
jgi:hypothetical protein